MGYQPLEDLLPKSGHSIYKLVRMAANRAAELAEGKKPLVDINPNEKTATVALEEILGGKVELKEISEQRSAEERQELTDKVIVA